MLAVVFTFFRGVTTCECHNLPALWPQLVRQTKAIHCLPHSLTADFIGCEDYKTRPLVNTGRQNTDRDGTTHQKSPLEKHLTGTRTELFAILLLLGRANCTFDLHINEAVSHENPCQARNHRHPQLNGTIHRPRVLVVGGGVQYCKPSGNRNEYLPLYYLSEPLNRGLLYFIQSNAGRRANRSTATKLRPVKTPARLSNDFTWDISITKRDTHQMFYSEKGKANSENCTKY